MGEIREHRPVNLIIGILTGIEELLSFTESQLEKEFGAIDIKSDIIPFRVTDYYQDEMGGNLKRRFFGFEGLIEPDRLSDIKLWTNRFEDDLADKGEYPVSRPINLDPGYMTEAKLVLGSTKDFSHRVYVGKGVYAEVTLRYLSDGHYEAQPWTFPDYKTGEYHQFFLKMRNLYREKLKGSGK